MTAADSAPALRGAVWDCGGTEECPLTVLQTSVAITIQPSPLLLRLQSIPSQSLTPPLPHTPTPVHISLLYKYILGLRVIMGGLALTYLCEMQIFSYALALPKCNAIVDRVSPPDTDTTMASCIVIIKLKGILSKLKGKYILFSFIVLN